MSGPYPTKWADPILLNERTLLYPNSKHLTLSFSRSFYMPIKILLNEGGFSINPKNSNLKYVIFFLI